MPIPADLVYELKAAADPAVSPDGLRLVYAQSWVDGTGATAEARSRLMMADLALRESDNQGVETAWSTPRVTSMAAPDFPPTALGWLF